jgi:DNA-binding transcriptional LysR family regulator
VGKVELVPVAAPDHPLAASAREGRAAPGESREHLQLVLADRSKLTEGREFSVLSPLTWRLGDLGAKHTLLLEGLGWGNMPRAMVAGDLERGRLVELDLPERPGAQYRLSALWRRNARLGPATNWLIDAFRERLSAET